MLLTPPRQRSTQLPARVQLIHHQLDQLQVLRVLQFGLGEDGGEFGFGGGAVEGCGGGGVVVEREEVGVGMWDYVVVCCWTY